jgi:hypothetical protein
MNETPWIQSDKFSMHLASCSLIIGSSTYVNNYKGHPKSSAHLGIEKGGIY